MMVGYCWHRCGDETLLCKLVIHYSYVMKTRNQVNMVILYCSLCALCWQLEISYLIGEFSKTLFVFVDCGFSTSKSHHFTLNVALRNISNSHST